MHYHLLKKYYFISRLDTNYIHKHSSKITFIYRNYKDILPNIKNILEFRDYCYQLICDKVILKYEKNFGIDDVVVEEDLSE